jgi:bifunctional enzyme CysN/CysC
VPSITAIKHRVNVNTLAHEASTQLLLNDISVCTLASSKNLVYDSYAQCKTMGGFILVDRFSHATVALGLIHHSLRRAQNVHRQALDHYPRRPRTPEWP